VPGSFRLLVVDDDPRGAAEAALACETDFVVLSFPDVRQALKAAPDWEPDLIVCDAASADVALLLDGLCASAAIAKFPAIILAQPEDAQQAKALGAAAVIRKPFDPERLAETVRRHLVLIRLNAAGYDFSQRLRRDAEALAAFRPRLAQAAAPQELQSFAHKLAGAAGIFKFAAVSSKAAALEDAIINMRAGRAAPDLVAANLDALLECITRA